MADVVQHGPIIQSFPRLGAVLAKITREREDPADRRAKHCLHGWVVAPYPRRKSKSRTGGTTYVDQSNIHVVSGVRETFASLVVLGCFQYAITAFAKILRQRMTHEHVLFDDHYSCGLHAYYSAGPSISAISIAICLES